MPTYDKDGHLFGDAYFNADYFHVGNEASEKTFINVENEELEIHNLAEPTEDNDAATKKYVDDNAGGGGGDIVKIVYDSLTMDIGNLGEAARGVLQNGKIPVIDWDNNLYYYQRPYTNGDSTFIGYEFLGWSAAVDEEGFTWLTAYGLNMQKANGVWGYEASSKRVAFSQS